MIIADVQIHGYRKGHQLLASSITLSKDDQSIVDRLSDVAGPLRPKEQFAPYLTAYPLPSGTYYVVARTWQDLTVARAGCVRTKSVLIDIHAWSRNPPINSVLRWLGSVEPPEEAEAVPIELEQLPSEQLPSVHHFSSNELLEALFLEDAKPVVVFDAPDPEIVAMRLIAALWPEIRHRFSLSTFALSPRKIGGRDLDLVFAPSNARSKFTDWPGRRVDGRTSQIDRHRWTGTIVRRVFGEPVPMLLTNDEIELLGTHEGGSAATLRLALMWDELIDKLDRMPAAALGLLDIANSGMVSNQKALQTLEPRLVKAMHQVIGSMSLGDAWDFVGAIARKMHGYDMPDAGIAVGRLIADLSEREPAGAVSLLRQPDPKGAIDRLLPSIAIGLGNSMEPNVEQMLVSSPGEIVARLICQGGPLTKRMAEDEVLIEKMAVVLTEVDQDLAERAGTKLLPFLVEDRHLPAALPIFNRLGGKEIAAELDWLGDANNFSAQLLCAALIDRARQVGDLGDVRKVLMSSVGSEHRNALLALTVRPVKEDVLWILDERRLSETVLSTLLVETLKNSDDRQFAKLLSDQVIGERVVVRLIVENIDLLVRALMQDILPMHLFVQAIQAVIPKIESARKFDIASRALGRCLRSRFEGDEVSVLSMLLGTLDAELNGGWVARTGLDRTIDRRIASRNMNAFNLAPYGARERIVGAVDDIARALYGRGSFDMTEEANNACASLMLDAEKAARKSAIDAANWLTPTLLRAHNKPVSMLIAVLFPIVYRDLAKTEDAYDFFNIVSFFEFDRRKAARNELVTAFMSSSWRAGDLALTACRCNDTTNILKRVELSHRGNKYLERIENDLGRLSDVDRRLVKRTIAEIR